MPNLQTSVDPQAVDYKSNLTDSSEWNPEPFESAPQEGGARASIVSQYYDPNEPLRKPNERLLGNFIIKGEPSIQFGPPGCQKSFFNAEIAAALAKGVHPWPDAERLLNHRAPNRTRVLMLSSEMDMDRLIHRHGRAWADGIHSSDIIEAGPYAGRRMDWLRVVKVQTRRYLNEPLRPWVECLQDELELGILEGVPFEVSCIDNYTRLSPGELSDQKHAGNLLENLFMFSDPTGRYGASVYGTFHMNKNAKESYDRVDINQMKGNAVFEALSDSWIGMNESKVRKDGSYLIEGKTKTGSKENRHDHTRAALFRTVQMPPEPEIPAPVRLVYEGVDTEDAERGKGLSARDFMKTKVLQHLDAEPGLTYTQMIKKLEAEEVADAREVLKESTFKDWRSQHRKAKGYDNKSF
jgi:hypothetical protein